MASAPATTTPPASTSGSAPPPVPLRQTFGDQTGKIDPAIKPDNNDAGSALNNLIKRKQQVVEEEAHQRRLLSSYNRSSQWWRGHCTSDHGSHVGFSLSTDPKKRREQIVDSIYRIWEQDREAGRPLSSKFYFYRGKELEPTYTKEATVLLSALSAEEGKFYRHGLTVSQDPLKTRLPWESNFLGMGDRAAERRMKTAQKASSKSTLEANKIA